MFKVRLINRELVPQQQYAVCGKSLKYYGEAFHRPEFGGMVFEMSLEDYNRDKFDLIGQTKYQQVWVPEFVEVVEASTQEVIEIAGNGTVQKPIVEPNPHRKEKTIKERAKAAGVWKRGMSEEEMRTALGFPD